MEKTIAPRGERKRDFKRPSKSRADTNEFGKWLAMLDADVVPTVHVNGHQHASAVVVVDFGAPVRAVRFGQEQTHEIIARLRKITRDVVGGDPNIRVGVDTSHGNCVYWSSL